jgi:hypothetical protein
MTNIIHNTRTGSLQCEQVQFKVIKVAHIEVLLHGLYRNEGEIANLKKGTYMSDVNSSIQSPILQGVQRMPRFVYNISTATNSTVHERFLCDSLLQVLSIKLSL